MNCGSWHPKSKSKFNALKNEIAELETQGEMAFRHKVRLHSPSLWIVRMRSSGDGKNNTGTPTHGAAC
jgi:hypothetical protein